MTDQPFLPPDLDVIRKYLEIRDEDQRTFGRLQSATQALSTEVAGLRNALSTYATTARVTDVEETAERNLRASEKAKLEALVQLRLRIRRRANWMFVITVVLLLAEALAYGLIFRSYTEDRHSACVERNRNATAQAERTRAFFGPKLRDEQDQPHSDPVMVSILQALSKQRPLLLRCN